MRTINLVGTSVDYEFRKSPRAKSARITLYPDGHMVVSVPRFRTHLSAERLLRYKEEWVIKSLEKCKKKKIIMVPKLLKKEQTKIKKELKIRLLDRIDYFNKIMEVKFERISMKQMKTQWGSCSSRNNLNFNIRMGYLPDRLFDYVVVHEMAHLKEHNHSNRFWEFLESVIPDYKKLDKDLGRYILR